ncbi:uncharacterized protein Z518_05507 [Rhinocladiella mackenziei CBS 650.93]|uniref:AHC1-like C2H2 zinc-finger domain-containing protein n=1 Tax=Rhinocladiella mackenziei CBS 650.93 TaxID=1442369 RepID=A0A0D2FR17_9EURO|nr:uncharacterized protein Z518_05507 [Rhinocladiella mackenziei CBS 650.93]KIX04637.1 hypothetical protein Z518_05507 [Rhinocladiella mackenziei CBS 650.93]
MLRLLSWTGCDKVNSPEMRMFVPKQDSPGSGVLTIPSSNKRKQTTDHHGQSERKRARIVDKRKNGSVNVPNNSAPTLSSDGRTNTPPTTPGPPSFLPSPPDLKIAESGMPDMTSPVKDAAAVRLESVRNVIQTQISLEILLKHKELRLIEQEMAKCQVALEQLRRCKEIPYPGTQQPFLAVCNGTGPALRSSFPTPLPQSPAPWGVRDGPYTRHYAKWLLPDPLFDGGEPEPAYDIPAGKSPMKSRSTRGSYADGFHTSSQSRAQRSGHLKALPSGNVPPKEKSHNPTIVERKSDGLMVRLVCPDCGRHDFGSAQGFINHCRIGHGRLFASHDAAADACGEPVQVDASGAVIGAEPTVPSTAGNVHPLIRSAKLLQPSVLAARSSSATKDSAGVSQSQDISPDFKASVLTPNLSELVKNKGLGLDLQEMVSDAKTKVEMPESESEDDEMDLVDVPVPNAIQGRHPQVAGTKPPRKPAKSPASSPLLSSNMLSTPAASRAPAAGLQQHGGASESFAPQRPRGMTLPMSQPSAIQLQPSDPSPTSESNQAPSLVDDDEEYEPHSPTSSSVSDDEHDVGEVQFEVQGDDDDARSVLRGPEFQPNCAQPARPTPHVRRPSAIRRQGEDREEKHVSFVSPSPARDMPAARQSGDRKRRKT